MRGWKQTQNSKIQFSWKNICQFNLSVTSKVSSHVSRSWWYWLNDIGAIRAIGDWVVGVGGCIALIRVREWPIDWGRSWAVVHGFVIQQVWNSWTQQHVTLTELILIIDDHIKVSKSVLECEAKYVLELDSTMSQSWIEFWNWILNFNFKTICLGYLSLPWKFELNWTSGTLSRITLFSK